MLPIWAICLIILAIMVSIPWIYGLLLPIIKPNLTEKASIYLYAFSAGFFLILSTFGFFVEAKEYINLWVGELNSHSYGGITEIVISEPISWVISMAIIGGGAFLFLLLALGGKYFFSKLLNKNTEKNNKVSQESVNNIVHHNHDDHGHMHDFSFFNVNDSHPKTRVYSLFLLFIHRISDGLIIGVLVFNVNSNKELSLVNVIFLVSFFIHIIPDELISYYRQIDAGVNRWKAALNSMLITSILIPSIFLGAYVFVNFEKDFPAGYNMLMAFMNVIIGSFFLFTALVEFIPEVLHTKMSKKTFYIGMIVMFIGIMLGLMVFSIHVHDHGDDHGGHVHSLIEYETQNMLNLKITRLKI